MTAKYNGTRSLVTVGIATAGAPDVGHDTHARITSGSRGWARRRIRLSGVWMWGLAVFVATCGVRVARACSGGTVSVSTRTTMPADGDVDVPLNARVLVRYVGSASIRYPQVRLRQVGNDEFPMQQTTLVAPGTTVIQPAAALQPNTRYEILDGMVVPCLGMECVPGDPRVVASFTTGATADETPPTFSGLVSVRAEMVPPFSLPWACSGAVHQFVLKWNPGNDERLRSSVTYSVYSSSRPTVPVLEYEAGTEAILAGVCGVNGGLVTARGVIGPHVRVRARDVAGNEDGNVVDLEVPSVCKSDGGVGSDGGIGGHDGGMGQDGGSSDDGGMGGHGGGEDGATGGDNGAADGGAAGGDTGLGGQGGQRDHGAAGNSGTDGSGGTSGSSAGGSGGNAPGGDTAGTGAGAASGSSRSTGGCTIGGPAGSFAGAAAALVLLIAWAARPSTRRRSAHKRDGLLRG